MKFHGLNFVRTAVLMTGIAVAATLTPTMSLAKSVTIKLAHPNVPQHPMGQAFEHFKKLVEERSQGEIKVTIYDSGKFGDDADITQGLQIGTLQMGSSSTPNLVPFSSAFVLFDMPYLFPDYEATDLITDGEIGKKLAKSLESSGIMGLGYIDIGFRHIFNSVRPVKTLADLKGLKLRSTASKAHIETLKALGANPTPMTWSEVYTALQQRTVDGVSIDLNLAYFNKFQEVTDNLTLSGETYSPHLVMISSKLYNSLEPEQQRLIVDAFDETKKYERKLIRDNEESIIRELKGNGFNVVELDDDQKAEFENAVKGVYDQFSSQLGDVLEEARQVIREGQ